MTTPTMPSANSDYGQSKVPTPKVALPPPVDAYVTKLSRDEKAQIIGWVRKQYRECKNQRTRFEQIWYTNLAFYMGKQNIAVVQSTVNGTKLMTPKAPYWRARPVFNKIRPTIRREVSKLMSQEPTAFVVPASNEDSDLFAAQAAENIWNSFYDSKNVLAVFTQSAFWMSITGVSYVKAWWDPAKIDPVNDMPGDICYESVTPFHVFVPDLEQIEIEDQPYVIHAAMQSIDIVNQTYGAFLQEPIKATGRSETIMDTGFLHLIGADDPPLDAVEVIECWVKPGKFKQFPDGVMIVMVGEQLAYVSPGWPYSHNKYPFAKLQHILSGGFYADSVITDLIPLQKEYNRTQGQIIEAKNRMAKPQLMAVKGSVNPSSITTEPGQVILYRAGFNPPAPIPLVPLPNYVLQELDRILLDWEDISGQHAVSKGTVPPGVTAATAISYLQEQDDTMLMHSVKSIEKATQKIAYLTLNYVVQYWDIERMVKVTGADGSFDVIQMMGADIKGNTDIRIEKDSALPTSRAAKQAFIMDLMKMGWLDPNKGLEMLEIGGINKLYEQINVDKRQAQRENIRMQKLDPQMVIMWAQAAEQHQQMTDQSMQQTGQPLIGQDGAPIPPPPAPIPANGWDNHLVHLEVHNNFRKSQSFEALPAELKQVFEAHTQLHEQALRSGIVSPELGLVPPNVPPATMGPGQGPPPSNSNNSGPQVKEQKPNG